MHKVSRPLILSAALIMLWTLATAEAQKPTTPTPPKAPVKPVSTVKPPPAPATGAVSIVCRDFRFGQMPGSLPLRDAEITYESISVKDTSGTSRYLYVPTHIIISHEFKPSMIAIGANGRDLVSGECGTPNAIITGATGSVTLQFNNFPSVFVQVGKKGANDMSLQAVVNLPPCPSGLRIFRTTRQDANTFFISSASDATCLS